MPPSPHLNLIIHGIDRKDSRHIKPQRQREGNPSRNDDVAAFECPLAKDGHDVEVLDDETEEQEQELDAFDGEGVGDEESAAPGCGEAELVGEVVEAA